MTVARARQLATAVSPALLTLALVAFVSQAGIAVMLPLLPLYATELGAPPFVLGLLTSSFAITNGIGQLGTGFLADRYGSRRFITGGLGLYAAMNLLIATAASAPWLLAWRSLAGFGGGAMIVAERLYLTDVTDRARRAFANGIISAGHSAGSVTGPAIGGLLAAVADLRAPFILVAATSMVAFVGTLFLPRPAPRTEAPPGHEAPAAAPIAYGTLGVLLAANLALMAGYGGFITTYAPLATSRLAWSTLDVGIVFSFFGAGSILLGPALAHLADRVGRRPVATLAVIPIAAFGLTLVAGTPQSIVFVVAVLAGAGLTAYTSAWYALLADAAEERRRGRIFGVVSAISNAGIVVGAMGATQLWERVDISLGMASASVAILLAGALLLALRPAPPALPRDRVVAAE